MNFITGHHKFLHDKNRVFFSTREDEDSLVNFFKKNKFINFLTNTMV